MRQPLSRINSQSVFSCVSRSRRFRTQKMEHGRVRYEVNCEPPTLLALEDVKYLEEEKGYYTDSSSELLFSSPYSTGINSNRSNSRVNSNTPSSLLNADIPRGYEISISGYERSRREGTSLYIHCEELHFGSWPNALVDNHIYLLDNPQSVNNILAPHNLMSHMFEQLRLSPSGMRTITTPSDTDEQDIEIHEGLSLSSGNYHEVLINPNSQPNLEEQEEDDDESVSLLSQGAQWSTINALPTRGYYVKDKQTPGEEVESNVQMSCCICMDFFKSEETVRTLPCLHFFHVACIDKWLPINRTCPICKYDVNNIYDSLMIG